MHDVEKRYLNLAGKVRQLIHSKDAAIGAWQQSVMHSQFTAKLVATASRLDGIDVANQVGDGYVGSGELLDIPFLRTKPGNGRGIALLSQQITATPAEWCIRIVVDLASGDKGKMGVE